MTWLNEIVDIDKLESLIQAGYISRRIHEKFPLAILNYSPLSQFDPDLIWGNEMNLSRGFIYNTKTLEVVSRPFSKFWNFADSRHPETLGENLPEEIPIVLEKLDGSLAIFYEYDGLNYVATRGSFHSEQAVWATNWLQTHYPRLVLPKEYTILGEILYRENKIVIDYDYEGIIILGAVNKQTGKELPRNELKSYCISQNLTLVKEYKKSLSETLQENIKNREGYVLTYPSTGIKVKIKFENYCRIHKTIFGMNIHGVWELLRDGNNTIFDEWIADERLPESFKNWVTTNVQQMRSQYAMILNRAITIFKFQPNIDQFMPYKDSRKLVASYFMQEQNRPYSSLLFSLLDGKSIDQQIWKMIEPKGNVPFKVED